MTEVVKNSVDYHYTECGLDNVLIKNMPVVKDDDGDEIVMIKGINVLHCLILLALVEKDGAWSPKEFKFVRTELGMTQSQLGELVDKDRQTIARWEKDETEVDRNAEKVIRLQVIDHLSELKVLEASEIESELTQVRVVSNRVRPGAANQQIVIDASGDRYTRIAA